MARVIEIYKLNSHKEFERVDGPFATHAEGVDRLRMIAKKGCETLKRERVFNTWELGRIGREFFYVMTTEEKQRFEETLLLRSASKPETSIANVRLAQRSIANV